MLEPDIRALTTLDRLRQSLHCLDTPISQLPLLRRPPGHDDNKPRPAAVLIPIHLQPTPSVLLTVRSRHLQNHPGQIAFPGGAADLDDLGPIGTAIREAWEEVGLPMEQVVPLGYLERLDTVSGYRVVPVIATVQGEYAMRLDPSEVDTAFHVPLDYALRRRNYFFETREHRGQSYRLPVLQYEQWRVWGATAVMLWRLCLLAEKNKPE